jgi:hypothetical protein
MTCSGYRRKLDTRDEVLHHITGVIASTEKLKVALTRGTRHILTEQESAFMKNATLMMEAICSSET